MSVTPEHVVSRITVTVPTPLASELRDQLTPSLFALSCTQCDAQFTAMIYSGPDGASIAVLASCQGGLATPHTPSGVAYYLDQAQKAQSMGAYSASIAMYRAAIEHLLFEQGYKKGMLQTKIKDLEDAVIARSAPKRANELDMDYLEVLKNLGNGAIHPNDGDVMKQAALDSDLIGKVMVTVHALLYLVYEVPHLKQSHRTL